MTLGEKINEIGFRQNHVHKKCGEKGLKTHVTHFNQWCKDVYAPRDPNAFRIIGEVIGLEEEEVKQLFSKYKSE